MKDGMLVIPDRMEFKDQFKLFNPSTKGKESALYLHVKYKGISKKIIYEFDREALRLP